MRKTPLMVLRFALRASAIGDLGWCIRLVTLFCCCSCYVAAQEKPPDLSGLWYFGSLSGPPNVKFFQEGANIKSVFIAVDPEVEKKWGFVVGDPNIEGTI